MNRSRHQPRSGSVACEGLEQRSLFNTTGAIYGQYYDNADFTKPSFNRSDPGIHFNWQTRAPLTRMGTTNFSARWMGQIRTTVDGVYTFNLDTDGAAALRIRGQTLALSPAPGGTGQVASMRLYADQVVDFQLDYSHTTGSARVNLDWTPPNQTTPSAIPLDRFINSLAPPAAKITNPIIGSGADPWVIQYQDEYIYVWSDGGRIWGSRSARLQDIGKSPQVLLWTAPSTGDHSRNVWAPELHQLDGQWYLYFAADDGNNANHRMFVASRNAVDPLGAFNYSGKLAATTDRWAIDGTVLDYAGSRYLVWSGWAGTTDGQQNLYIAKMASPTSLTGDRVLIAQPTANWERNGLPINEGPQVLQRNGETHIIYSGSGYWTNEYALGDLKMTGTNPLTSLSWTKQPGPVFSQANGVAGVGHASFVKSPDGKEDWIVYHAHRDPNTFVDDRVVRTQPFTFNGGTPVFGAPVSNTTVITEPSGTPTLIQPSLAGVVGSQRSQLTFGDDVIGTLIDDAVARPVAASILPPLPTKPRLALKR